MLDNVRKYKLMPDEFFSKKMRTSTDGSMAKVLFSDIVHQIRLPAGISSVDASNCYDHDRIAHAIASLIFQSCGVPDTAVK